MGIGDASEATTSEGTVEIKIKTLDSQTYTLRVNKRVPVPRLKEQIATITGVLSDQQRLICRGKVLKDDELLSAYHVEDGHTLHLVVRQPPQSSGRPTTGHLAPEGVSSHPAINSSTTSPIHGGRGTRIVFETVNIGNGDNSMQHLSQIIQGVLNPFTPRNTASNTTRVDVTQELGARVSNDTSRSEFDPQQAPLLFQSAVSLGPEQPMVIPDALTTINQYMRFMQNEFTAEGFIATGTENGDSAGAAGLHFNHQQPSSEIGLPNPASLAEALNFLRQLLMEQTGTFLSQLARRLENHASVVDPSLRMSLQNRVLRSGVLLQNLGSLLLELGRTTMTLRTGQTPSDAIINAGPAVFISGSGPNPVMVQPVPFYPGSNYGPPRMRDIYAGGGLQSEPFGSPFIPTSIGIRFRPGRTVPDSTTSQSEQSDLEHVQVQPDALRNFFDTNGSQQAPSGVLSGQSFAGESGIRVLPITTVVAVPAGVNRSPANPSSAVGLIYPLVARVRHVNDGNHDDSRISTVSNETNQNERNIYQQINLQSSTESQNLGSNSGIPLSGGNNFTASHVPLFSAESTRNESAGLQDSVRLFAASQQEPLTSNSSTSPQAHLRQQISEDPLSQLASRLIQSIFGGEQVQVGLTSHHPSGTESSIDNITMDGSSRQQEERRLDNEDGVFFSNMVRQLWPFISQGMTSRQTGSPASHVSSAQVVEQNSSEASTSQHDRDPAEAPSPKRPKTQ